MEFLQAFHRMMENTKDIALATSVNNVPNVRVVNFYYDPQKKGVLYFSSIKDNPKTFEFSQNNKVAFTTIPVDMIEHTRVTKGIVKKSDFTIFDLKEAFIKKYPSYEIMIAQAGDRLAIYEIHFNEANITLSFDKQGKVTL
ncbi:putative pyridoxamine 5'-phosphate oxidase family protein [Anaerosolibacter carboniphilus]|uniref:Putative pyridoxamine 5'-phosphate oxidase family protein n=1 Tax=Anaerosolibacter carboniphilus TaxID=1417629 RepID=A0A841KU98_9FIRM|nr:pyridoxamine 5'-phosphate oxidase family protein [Anaerosolibacter carboniphilus]MBB6214502.1 putative pyridoxamine 5'-phosphate oxidase family protein [Anaerosolibacter carboniphilus]